MKRVPRRTYFMCASLLVAVPFAASAVTVQVNGAADVLGTSYQTLSGAVNYVQSQGAGPHTVNITVDNLPTPDGQVYINTELSRYFGRSSRN
jgi:hypothetical protein